MLKKKTYILLFLILGFFMQSCEDDDAVNPKELPALSMEGKQTFGCKINGENWMPFQRNIPQLNSVIIPAIWAKMNNNQLKLSVNNQNNFETFSFTIDNIKDPGLYKFQALSPSKIAQKSTYASIFQKCVLGNCSAYVVNDTAKNEVHLIKIDKVNKIVSGTFTVNFVDKKTKSILSITEGRFDLHTN